MAGGRAKEGSFRFRRCAAASPPDTSAGCPPARRESTRACRGSQRFADAAQGVVAVDGRRCAVRMTAPPSLVLAPRLGLACGARLSGPGSGGRRIQRITAIPKRGDALARGLRRTTAARAATRHRRAGHPRAAPTCWRWGPGHMHGTWRSTSTSGCARWRAPRRDAGHAGAAGNGRGRRLVRAPRLPAWPPSAVARTRGAAIGAPLLRQRARRPRRIGARTASTLQVRPAPPRPPRLPARLRRGAAPRPTPPPPPVRHVPRSRRRVVRRPEALCSQRVLPPMRKPVSSR